MEALFFAIVVIVGIVRVLYYFVRWSIRSLKRLGVPGTPGTPLQPLGPKPMVQQSPRPEPGRAASSPAVTSSILAGESSASVFRSRENQDPIVEAQSRIESQDPIPLFGTTSDLVRALILQEVLGPPLSKRKHPPLQ